MAASVAHGLSRYHSSRANRQANENYTVTVSLNKPRSRKIPLLSSKVLFTPSGSPDPRYYDGVLYRIRLPYFRFSKPVLSVSSLEKRDD